MGMFRHTMTAAGGNSHEANVNLYRIEQSYIALLFPPSLLQGAILFMRLQAAWLDGLLKRPPAEARAALEAVPEWVVHDLCYFVDVVIMMYPEDLALQPLTPFVLALAGVLRAGSAALGQGGGGRLIRSPLVLAKVVKLLHDWWCRRTSGGRSRVRGRRQRDGAALGVGAGPRAGAHGAAAAADRGVRGGERGGGFGRRRGGGGGLQQVRDARDDTNALLLQLWQIADGRAAICAIVDEAEGESGAKLAPLLVAFGEAILDTVNYNLEEALKRVREVNNAQDFGLEEAEIQHYKGYARHLFETTYSTLELLGALTSDGRFAKFFSVGDVRRRLARCVVTFVDMLCGKRALDLKLKGTAHTADDFGFEPKRLLADMVRVLLRCAPYRPFVSTLADHPDLEIPTLRKAAAIVSREGILPPQSVDELAALIADLERFAAGASAAAASPGDAASGGGGGGGDETWELAAVLAEEVGEPHEWARTHRRRARRTPPHWRTRSSRFGRDPSPRSSTSARRRAARWYEGVAPKYKYTTEAAEAGDAVGPALRKALMREARSLQGGQLPLHPDAAIFVRPPDERRRWRCCAR